MVVSRPRPVPPPERPFPIGGYQISYSNQPLNLGQRPVTRTKRTTYEFLSGFVGRGFSP
jgi:hypothetical protein